MIISILLDVTDTVDNWGKGDTPKEHFRREMGPGNALNKCITVIRLGEWGAINQRR